MMKDQSTKDAGEDSFHGNLSAKVLMMCPGCRAGRMVR
jgi:hypothetical protein